MSNITVAELNSGTEEKFVETLGSVYEHSPWVAESAWTDAPFESADELYHSMKNAVKHSSRSKKRELLLKHPDLGEQTEMTDSSRQEQASAGLDSLTPDQYKKFQELNETYRDEFGFPFIMAVKGQSPEKIKEQMEQRIGNTENEEFETAMDEVHKIAKLRTDELIS